MPTVSELRETAEKRGITVPKRAKKAEIQELLAEDPLIAEFREKGRVVSVYGAFAARALIEMPADLAGELVGHGIKRIKGQTNVIEAVEGEVVDVADSALAATAIQLAYELANPYNSATSKAQCAKTLIEAMERIKDEAPPVHEEDGVSELAARRAARQSAA